MAYYSENARKIAIANSSCHGSVGRIPKGHGLSSEK